MVIRKHSLKRCHSEAPVKLARVFFSARVPGSPTRAILVLRVVGWE
jgi:hypothetical protein